MRGRVGSVAFALVLAAWGGACESSSGGDAGASGSAGTAGASSPRGGSAGTTANAGSGTAGGTATGGTGGRGGASPTGGNSGRGGTGTGGRGSGGDGGGGSTNGGTSGTGTGNGGSSGTAAGGMSTGGSSGTGSSGEAGQGTVDDRCGSSALVWRSANKTNYTSYPDPGSEECIKYNGCMWAGQFAACEAQMAESWVAANNIVAAFPDFGTLELHDLCLRKGTKTIVVTVLDTCGDSDCDGCCTENKGSADELIDIESYTNERWGVPDGPIEWADLGPTAGDGCGD